MKNRELQPDKSHYSNSSFFMLIFIYGEHWEGVNMLTNEQVKDIIKLRKQNNGYKTIANKLNISRNTVRYHCKKHDLGGKRAKQINQFGFLEEREKRFKKEFENKYHEFRYYSEFKSIDDYFKMQCKKCGYVQEKHAQCLRHSEEIICDNCRETKKRIESKRIKKLKEYQKKQNKINKEVDALKRIKINHRYYIECDRCGKRFFTNAKNVVHCNKCIREIKAEEKARREGWKGKIIKCKYCGEEFEMRSSRSKYCSEKCLNKVMNRKKEIERRERLKENGRINYDITLDKLIKRDNGICQICEKLIDNKDFEHDENGNFIAENDYPSIDHIVPVSKGGTHTWDNVQLAHFYCNSVKGNNIKEIS